ncbi:transposase [Trichonephila clavipes]|nr:transposase [Trichonephila clavipes]
MEKRKNKKKKGMDKVEKWLKDLRINRWRNIESNRSRWCKLTVVLGTKKKIYVMNYQPFMYQLRYRSLSWHYFQDGDRFNSFQVIYSQFGFAIHQNDHQARRRFVEWAQNEIAVVPDFHKRILFSDEAHFWLNGYVNKQKCRIWSEANPRVYVETPLHPEKLTVWCALWAGGILQKR